MEKRGKWRKALKKLCIKLINWVFRIKDVEGWRRCVGVKRSQNVESENDE